MKEAAPSREAWLSRINPQQQNKIRGENRMFSPRMNFWMQSGLKRAFAQLLNHRIQFFKRVF
jgi:hypothetical protein